MRMQRIEDWISIHLGHRAYLVFAWLFPIYTPMWLVRRPDYDMFTDILRFPFFVAWPLIWLRDVEIRVREWDVRRRAAR